MKNSAVRCRTDPEKDVKSTVTVCKKNKKNNERGADGNWGGLKVCS
jgi:hypothetical protein